MKKKIIGLGSALLFMTAATYAQAPETTSTSTEGVNFDIRAGINFQNINGKDYAGNSLDNKLKTGFHAGVDVEIPIATDFYLAPGVLFSLKGAKVDANDAKLSLSYIEVPVNFMYKPMLGSGRLRLGVGPYAAYGISGKYKVSGNSYDVKFKNEVDASSIVSDPYYRHLDFGGNLLAGYELSNNLFFQLNAQLGMVNINPDIKNLSSSSNKAKEKNTGFGVSVGYRF